MPKLSGLFESFDNLDQVDIDSLIGWLKGVPTNLNPIHLENYLANKILYPAALPLTQVDMKIDLAILREILRMSGPKEGSNTNSMLGDNPFLNATLRKIIIPEKFLQYIPDLVSLTWAFVDGLLLNRKKEDYFEDIWTVILADDIDQVVGTILLPQFNGESDVMNLKLLGKNFKIKSSNLAVVPCPKDRCEIAYKFNQGQILGKKENALEVYGGKLGLMIDGRIR